MKIREEKQTDFDEIYHFVQTAFSTAKVSDGDEQDYVNKLRAGDTYLPELALVMENDNEIIGHIMLTKFKVNNEDHKALLLAPLAIKKEYRNQQLGQELVKEACARAKELGYQSVFLVGDPEYYNRFGFVSSSKYHITNVNNIPAEYVQAMELVPGALKNVTGTIDFY